MLRASTAVTLAMISWLVGPPWPGRATPCDPRRVETAFTDTSEGVVARAFVSPTARDQRALVAVYPSGPAWTGYLVLATCDGRMLDSLGTGNVDSVVFRQVTTRHRVEALVGSVTGTGTGAATHTLWIVALRGDKLRTLWANPVLDYGYYEFGGGTDSAEVDFPTPGLLHYSGTMQKLARATASDSMENDGPPCQYADTWRWSAARDTFALATVPSTRAKCRDT